MALIRSFQVQHDYQILIPRAAGAIAEDEARRYVIDSDVLIKTPDGAEFAAMVVRPQSVISAKPLPAVLG